MKMIGNQVVMPLNVAKMIDENDPVYNKFHTDESPSFLTSYISIHLCVSLM